MTPQAEPDTHRKGSGGLQVRGSLGCPRPFVRVEASVNEKAQSIDGSEEHGAVVETHAPRSTVWGWVAVLVVLAFTAGTFVRFSGAL